MTQTVAYYRSSTDLQEDSVSTQEFYAMQYCSEKMLLIDKEISDEFVSAKLTPLTKRKFNQILEGIKKGEFNTLIIYKRDRLARDVIEYMEIYSVLKKYNVQVHFTTSNEAPMRYDETGEFYELIMAGLCQHEGEQIKLRISEGRSASFEQGKHKGVLPYGYLVDKDSGKIYVPPEAKKDILFIYSELLSEKHATLNDLKLYLKKHNIQRLRLKESKKFNPVWEVKAIEDMISNTMYMGIRQMNFKGKLHTYASKDYALLPVEEWYRAQEILKNIKSKKSRNKRPMGSFLLENFIICDECKQPLTPIMRMRKKAWVGVYECKAHKIKLLSDDVESEILDKCCCHFFSLLSEYGEDFYNKFSNENVNKIKILSNRLDQIIVLFNTQIIHNVTRLMGTNNVHEKSRLENKLVTIELKLKHVKGKKEQLYLTIEQLKKLPEQINLFKDKSKFTDALKNLSHNERLKLLNNIIMSTFVTHEGLKLYLKHPIKGSEESLLNIHNVLLPGKKGAFYGRHSTEEQTIDTQLHWANELAKEFGCEIIKEFVDIGVSAVKKNMAKRKGLTALLTYLETAEIDFVIIYDHTRLARNAMEHQKIRGFFNSKKIPVVMCSTRDLYNSGDLLGELLKDGYSKYEADAIRQRTEDNHYKKIKEGIYRGGKLPFGYEFSPDEYTFKVLPDEKEIVEDIFKKYQEGEGFHSIALSLKKQSFHGRDWTKDDVKLIITNPFYAGYLTAKRFHPNSHRQLTDKEEWIMGYCERITPFIRYEVWEHCYETYRSKRKGNVSPKNFKTPFFLRDILFCKNCKMPLKSKNQKNKYHGNPNGNSIYYCENKACSLRLEKNKVHKRFIEEEMSAVLIKYLSTQHKDIHEEILVNLKQKVDKLSQQIIELEIMIEEFTLQIRRTEVELHSLAPNKPQELKNSFLRYRILLKEKINNSQKSINEKKFKISYIENVESDFLLMKNLLVTTIMEEYDGEIDPRLRRLVLYLFERIEIGSDLVYDVTARINLENDNPVLIGGFIN